MTLRLHKYQVWRRPSFIYPLWRWYHTSVALPCSTERFECYFIEVLLLLVVHAKPSFIPRSPLASDSIIFSVTPSCGVLNSTQIIIISGMRNSDKIINNKCQINQVIYKWIIYVIFKIGRKLLIVEYLSILKDFTVVEIKVLCLFIK